MSDQEASRTEMWKTLKWGLILIVVLVIAACVFRAIHMASAPVRAVGSATESVKSGASAVMNRLDVPIKKQRAFDKAATAAFSHLNDLPQTEPENVKARGFRMANLRGAQSRVCELSHNFGTGDVPIFIAADNAAHEAAKAVASKADRLVRIIIASPKDTMGLHVEFDEASEHWDLSWRPSSINKPHPDSWAEGPMIEILRQVPKSCRVTP